MDHLKNFRTYQVAKEFYWLCKSCSLPGYLRSQLLRASSSVVLNLSEGSAKFSKREQKRFYGIAYASLAECISILDLENIKNSKLSITQNKLEAFLNNLIKSRF